MKGTGSGSEGRCRWRLRRAELNPLLALPSPSPYMQDVVMVRQGALLHQHLEVAAALQRARVSWWVGLGQPGQARRCHNDITRRPAQMAALHGASMPPPPPPPRQEETRTRTFLTVCARGPLCLQVRVGHARRAVPRAAPCTARVPGHGGAAGGAGPRDAHLPGWVLFMKGVTAQACCLRGH